MCSHATTASLATCDEPRLELTYNHGVDHYELGTAYGHIAVSAADLAATLERLATQGIEPERPPYQIREGGSQICFVRDPDGYRIEIVERVSEGVIDQPGTGQSAT